MQTTSPSALPRETGGFRLVREIGRGGMGIVYEAHEIDSGRVVALKVLAAELSVSGEAFERFRREARLAASISDARCVFVYGAHHVEESPAIAMELVGGETLQDKITRGDVIPTETAVRWAIDVIEGLEAAHRAGVIHRDVKPSNCFVTTDGQVKIGDFGLSRTLERDVELTQSGQFLGSPLYASPEQIRGRTVDARSDQYSCAATLYALLAGRAPFGGNNVGEVLARILSEDPPRLRSIRAAIPRELERVVLRGMERDSEKRYRDLEAFRAALLPFSNQTAAAASVPRRLAAWLLDATLITVVGGSIQGYVQASLDLPVDQERAWQTVPIALTMLLASGPMLYWALSEGLFATTFGKWVFGLRIAPVGPGPALWVRVIPRSFLYEIVGVVLLVPHHFLPRTPIEYAMTTPLLFLGQFAFRLSSMRKRNGWRGPHELWSRTRVIQAQLPFRSLRRATPPPETHSSAHTDLPAKLGEYRIVGLVGSTDSGPLLHARDERLERSVWIQFRDHAPVAGETRRSLSRPNRLRWLESLRAAARPADVFESPGGCGLAQIVASRRPVEWPMAERALAALIEEIARSEQEHGGPLRWSPNQVWIDRNWNVRVLDEPVPSARADHDGVALVGAAARALLGVGPDRDLPPDLPVHAESLVRSLTGENAPFPDLGSARNALNRSQAAVADVERRMRSAQIAVSTGLLGLIVASTFVLFLFIVDFIPHAAEMSSALRELKAGRLAASTAELASRPSSSESSGSGDDSAYGSDSDSTDGADSAEDERAPTPAPSGPVLDEESRRWRSIVVTYEMTHGFGKFGRTNLKPADREFVDRIAAETPDPTDEEFEDARRRIREQRGPGVAPNPIPFAGHSAAEYAVCFVAATSLLWTLAAWVSTVLIPAGLSFRLFGLSIRKRNGRRAGRLFGLLRASVFALPLTAGYAVAASIASPAMADLGLRFTSPGIPAWIGWVLFGVLASLHAAGIALSIAIPQRGPIDRLLSSRIVPR